VVLDDVVAQPLVADPGEIARWDGELVAAFTRDAGPGGKMVVVVQLIARGDNIEKPGELFAQPGAAVVLVASSLSFLGMGLMAAVFPLLSPEKGARAADIMGTLLLLISGVYYDVSVLPDWLRPLSTLSPGTYALRSIRAALLDGASISQVSGDLWILIITGFIMVPLGLWIFHIAEVYAKKTGLLKRSG